MLETETVLLQVKASVEAQHSPEERAEGIFTRMDINSDGKVTRQVDKADLFHRAYNGTNCTSAQARVCAGLHQGPEACGPPFPPISNIDLPPNKESSKALKHLEMTDAQGGMRERDTARQV